MDYERRRDEEMQWDLIVAAAFTVASLALIFVMGQLSGPIMRLPMAARLALFLLWGLTCGLGAALLAARRTDRPVRVTYGGDAWFVAFVVGNVTVWLLVTDAIPNVLARGLLVFVALFIELRILRNLGAPL
jgi:hypothetical protein